MVPSAFRPDVPRWKTRRFILWLWHVWEHVKLKLKKSTKFHYILKGVILLYYSIQYFKFVNHRSNELIPDFIFQPSVEFINLNKWKQISFFKSLYLICYNINLVLCFEFLAIQHVETKLPDQGVGLNSHSCTGRWSCNCQTARKSQKAHLL